MQTETFYKEETTHFNTAIMKIPLLTTLMNYFLSQDEQPIFINIPINTTLQF